MHAGAAYVVLARFTVR
uniref:Uncharacterized protein n=1 Tax=Anguilla anguilla TaxID=7936 RepID=A0A0E9VBU8_ANGAN